MLAAGAAPAGAAVPPWTISEASSGVLVVHSGISKIAARGGRAEAGDVIVTGTNARAVLVRGEEYAVVAPNSRLQVGDPVASGGMMQFLEKAGNVVFSIRKMATPHFGVQTPYLAAVVKGTTFSVTVDDRGASVQVVEGAVEVATQDGGARELVLPGNVASVGAADLGRLTIQGTSSKVIQSPRMPQQHRSSPVARRFTPTASNNAAAPAQVVTTAVIRSRNPRRQAEPRLRGEARRAIAPDNRKPQRRRLFWPMRSRKRRSPSRT